MYDSYCGGEFSIYTECVYVELGMEYCMCMTVTVVVGFLYTLNVCLC